MENFLDENNKYIKEARRIIDVLKKNFVLDNGVLCLNLYNGQKSKHHIFPDLGDVLPFFLYFKEEEFIDKQVGLFDKTLNNGILISEFPTFKIRGLAKSYEYSDLLLGLIDYYNFKKSEKSKKILIRNIDKVVDIFNFEASFYSFYWPKFKTRLPIRDSRDAMMIELFVEVYYLFNDRKYIEIAYNIYNRLINSSFYKKYKLLPTFSANLFFTSFSNKFKEAEICKANTSALFAFHALYLLNNDKKVLNTIYELLDSISNKASLDGGGIIKTYKIYGKNNNAFLTSSFAILDFLCDFYYSNKRERDLIFAKEIANFWLNKQENNGLFPLYSDGSEDFIDSETDMSVALFKLYELTNDIKYKHSAEKCLDGIIEVHGPHDYVISMDIKTEKVINSRKKTKFLGLFLKLLILKYELEKNNKIYKDKFLWNLLKDR